MNKDIRLCDRRIITNRWCIYIFRKFVCTAWQTGLESNYTVEHCILYLKYTAHTLKTISGFLAYPDITMLSRCEVSIGFKPHISGGQSPAAAAAGSQWTGQTKGCGQIFDWPAAWSPLHDQYRSGELPTGRTPLPVQVSPTNMRHSDKLPLRNGWLNLWNTSLLKRCF